MWTWGRAGRAGAQELGMEAGTLSCRRGLWFCLFTSLPVCFSACLAIRAMAKPYGLISHPASKRG